MDRRSFLKHTSATVGGIVTAATISTLTAHRTWAANRKLETPGASVASRAGMDYGPVKRTADQNGVEVLALPKGFEYVTFGKSGEVMSDGAVTPRNHDGMTCFPVSKDIVRLIRNHELRNAAGDFTLGVFGPEATRYDSKGMGGCVTLDFDIRRKALVRDFISLNGTVINCSGGLSYNDTGWLSCEESVSGPTQGFDKPHGFTFFVSRNAAYPAKAEPITAMGRFVKEAAVADNASGIVYQTEDDKNNSGFYRFIPNDPADLMSGGVLQMLAISGSPNYDTRTRQVVGAELQVAWVTIDNPNPDHVTFTTSCFAQGFAKGGARFNRLEGVFRGDAGSMYFVSTSGGDAQRGQIWQYIPGTTGGGTLALVYESPASSVLDCPDNICVTRSGGILICEDDTYSSQDGDTHKLAPGIRDVNRLIGLGKEGKPFEFAVNIYNSSEFAGACFSPDGEILFVNIFGTNAINSALTCAIWGPWRDGPL
jgi:secreted PhoX family phosphatase